MKKRQKRIFWAIVFFILLYIFMPLPFMGSFAVQECAFRYLYDAEQYGRKDRVKTVYLTIGEGNPFGSFAEWPGKGPSLKSNDPPDQLICRLSDLSVEIKPVSMYDSTWGESFTEDERLAQLCITFGAGPVIQSIGLARCRTFYHGGGLCAQENESFFIRTPFGWKHLFSFRLWIS